VRWSLPIIGGGGGGGSGYTGLGNTTPLPPIFQKPPPSSNGFNYPKPHCAVGPKNQKKTTTPTTPGGLRFAQSMFFSPLPLASQNKHHVFSHPFCLWGPPLHRVDGPEFYMRLPGLSFPFAFLWTYCHLHPVVSWILTPPCGLEFIRDGPTFVRVFTFFYFLSQKHPFFGPLVEEPRPNPGK